MPLQVHSGGRLHSIKHWGRVGLILILRSRCWMMMGLLRKVMMRIWMRIQSFLKLIQDLSLAHRIRMLYKVLGNLRINIIKNWSKLIGWFRLSIISNILMTQVTLRVRIFGQIQKIKRKGIRKKYLNLLPEIHSNQVHRPSETQILNHQTLLSKLISQSANQSDLVLDPAPVRKRDLKTLPSLLS